MAMALVGLKGPMNEMQTQTRQTHPIHSRRLIIVVAKANHRMQPEENTSTRRTYYFAGITFSQKLAHDSSFKVVPVTVLAASGQGKVLRCHGNGVRICM